MVKTWEGVMKGKRKRNNEERKMKIDEEKIENYILKKRRKIRCTWCERNLRNWNKKANKQIKNIKSEKEVKIKR